VGPTLWLRTKSTLRFFWYLHNAQLAHVNTGSVHIRNQEIHWIHLLHFYPQCPPSKSSAISSSRNWLPTGAFLLLACFRKINFLVNLNRVDALSTSNNGMREVAVIGRHSISKAKMGDTVIALENIPHKMSKSLSRKQPKNTTCMYVLIKYNT
jgi:hypothetical protein